MGNSIDNKIRRIAYALYLKSKKAGLENNSLRDWVEAEVIFYNKLKYCWWHTCNFFKKYHSSVIAAVAILSLFTNMLMMTWSIHVNNTSIDLNTRPYVSINMSNPKRFINQNDTFYGNGITLINKGKIPASNVHTQYYITTDMDKENMFGLDWFDKNLGGFGSTSFIVPDATEIEPGFRSLSPVAEYYYFEAITSYEGLKFNKKYWTHIKKIFYVDKDANSLYAVFSYGEWDRNRSFTPPPLASKNEIMDLIENIKKKREQKHAN